MSGEVRDLKIPDEWWAKPLRLAPAEQDSEPADDLAAFNLTEIERLAELGNSITPRREN